MLCINPEAAPFALSPNNQIPKAIRDTVYWDDNGDVLLVTKDGMVLLLRMDLLLRYSETIRSLLAHIPGNPQEGLWTPILELECSTAEMRTVLEYLLLEEQGIQPSIESLARYAFSAYTLGIQRLDSAALTGLLTCARERLCAYAHWEGTTEFGAPPLNPVHAIRAARTLPEPASSTLVIAFVDASIFAFDETAIYHPDDAPRLQGTNDEDTLALLRERNAELVGSLLDLSKTFGRRRTLAKVGRPCCNFELFAADHTPNLHMTASMKGRCALSIITATGAELERAMSRRMPAQTESQQAGRHPSGLSDHLRCSSCIAELHQGMKRLYGQWWEDMGRLLMGEPRDGCSSVWDDVRNSLAASQTPTAPLKSRKRFGRFFQRIFPSLTGLQAVL